MKVLDFNDEAVRIDIDGYLVPYLYVAAVIAGETIYKFLFESLKELFTKLQRENIFI